MEKNHLKRVKVWLWLMLIINLVASVALIYSIKIIPTIVDYYELGYNFVILYVLSIPIQIIITLAIAILLFKYKKGALIAFLIAKMSEFFLYIIVCNIVSDIIEPFTVGRIIKMVITTVVIPLITILLTDNYIFNGTLNKIKKIYFVLIVIMVIAVAGNVAYHYQIVKERTAILAEFEMEDGDLSDFNSVYKIRIKKLNEENHERIAYGINHMPMLKSISIYFDNKEDIDLNYLSEFDLKDKSIEVMLINCDGRSLKPLSDIGKISNMLVSGGSEIDFSGLDNVIKLEIWDTTIREQSNLGNMENLETIKIKGSEIDGFGDMSNLKKLEDITIEYYEEDELSEKQKSISGLETLDHEINLKAESYLEQNIIDELENVKISKLNIKNSPEMDLKKLKNSSCIQLNGDITDETLEKISNNSEIESLSLSGNIQVDNYAVLNNMTKLSELKICNYSENVINLETISQLTGIKSLTLYGDEKCRISDISEIGKMYWLEEFEITNQSVSDISSIQNMTNLQKLNISGTDVSDISILSNIPNLESINIGGTKVTDLSVLTQFTELKELGISGLNLDISILASFNNLEVLHLKNTSISDYSPLANLKNLRELDLEKSSITNLDIVSEMNDLEILNISGCRIKDISALNEKEKLIDLDISETDVMDISPLNKCKELVILDISSTAIRDFTPLKNASKLKIIKAYDTNTSASDWLPVRNVNNILPIFQMVI